MSASPLSVSAGVSPSIQHGGRHGPEPSAPQSGFGAIMQSLSEKGGRSKGSESANKASVAAAIPSVQGDNAPAALPTPEAQAGGLTAASARLPSTFAASVPCGTNSSSSPPPNASGASPAATSSSVDGIAATQLLSVLGDSSAAASSAAASPYFGAQKAARSASIPARGPAGSDIEAFSTTAAAMGLRVSHAASHLGLALPSQLTGANSSSAVSGAPTNSLPPATEHASASIAEIASLLADGGGDRTVVDSGGESGVGSAMSFTGVSLSLIPDVVAEATASLEQPEAASSQASATPVSTASNAKVVGARELEVELSPAELGSLTVKLKLVGSALSVVIEASKPSTLSAIERERDTIISRITSADHEVSSLILRPSDSPPNAHENGEDYGQVAQNGGNGQQQTAQRPPGREAGANKKDSSPENPSPSDSPGYLVV